MELKCLQLHCIQSDQQFGRPLKTQAPFSPAGVNEEILNPGRPDNPPLALQFSPGCVCARGDPLRLVWADSGRRKVDDQIAKFHVVGRHGHHRLLTQTRRRRGRAIDESKHGYNGRRKDDVSCNRASLIRSIKAKKVTTITKMPTPFAAHLEPRKEKGFSSLPFVLVQATG